MPSTSGSGSTTDLRVVVFASLHHPDPRAAQVIRCWWCGAYAERVEVTTWDDLSRGERVYIPGMWVESPGARKDHEHGEAPPTPAQLAAAGHAALQRCLAIWGE